jgi:hypothetical protein
MGSRFLIVLASAGMAAAQSSFSGTATFGPGYPMGPAVTGAPYSGEEVSENVTILADGTRITQKMMRRKVWRDFEGRTRTERPLGMGPTQASIPIIIEITDPVAGFKYTLDTQNKVVHRQKMAAFPSSGMGIGGSGGTVVRSLSMGATAAPPVAAPQGEAPMRPRFTNEPLGARTIDGVIAEGTRNTTTYPVGMMGNDREFSSVSETWTSPDLKIVILHKTNDPRSGESTTRLDNLSRTPPDRMLFLPPPDYTVVDEAGAFSIHWGNRQ